MCDTFWSSGTTASFSLGDSISIHMRASLSSRVAISLCRTACSLLGCHCMTASCLLERQLDCLTNPCLLGSQFHCMTAS